METINNYLENMFVSLPKTKEMLKLKEDILNNMEEKYHELKREGMSENEAIGIVISEFGNIDEIVEEFGIKKNSEGKVLKNITKEEAEDYIIAKKKSGKIVGIGVILCMIGGAVLILINKLFEDGILLNDLPTGTHDTLGIFIALIFVAPAIGIFIYNGSVMEKYKFLEEDFELSLSLKTSIEQRLNEFSPKYTVSTIFSVCLCVLSPSILFIANLLGDEESNYGVCALLLYLSIAIYVLIYYGNIRESYKVLLKLRESDKPQHKKNNRIIGAVAAIVWPVAVCIFLISGLVFEQWQINWVVFPITGILFGMFSSVVSILSNKEESSR